MQEQRFFMFFFVWALLGIFHFLFYYVYRGVALKKKLHPLIMSATGLIFILAVLWITEGKISPATAELTVLATGVVTFLNIKLMRFCENCGIVVPRFNPFYKVTHCPKCGKELGK
jgi:membrane-associated PAP2 superfamily phosphatase